MITATVLAALSHFSRFPLLLQCGGGGVCDSGSDVLQGAAGPELWHSIPCGVPSCIGIRSYAQITGGRDTPAHSFLPFPSMPLPLGHGPCTRPVLGLWDLSPKSTVSQRCSALSRTRKKAAVLVPILQRLPRDLAQSSSDLAQDWTDQPGPRPLSHGVPRRFLTNDGPSPLAATASKQG